MHVIITNTRRERHNTLEDIFTRHLLLWSREWHITLEDMFLNLKHAFLLYNGILNTLFETK